MIACVTYQNWHETGAAFRAQFSLRHKCFIERQSYDVRSYQGMEYDQYDTPAAIYLVYMAQGEALGCSRLTPVEQGSMISDLWPGLINSPADLLQEGIWEGTRFCIERSLPADMRQQICKELVLAYLEAGLAFGMRYIIGVMPPPIMKRVFGATGCAYEALGPVLRIPSGDVITAARMPVNALALAHVRQKTGLASPVIEYTPAPTLIRQAA